MSFPDLLPNWQPYMLTATVIAVCLWIAVDDVAGRIGEVRGVYTIVGAFVSLVAIFLIWIAWGVTQ